MRKSLEIRCKQHSSETTEINKYFNQECFSFFLMSCCRSYQEVDWDAMLPRRFLAPPTTLEKMADPVTGCSSPARYPTGPQLWQVSNDSHTGRTSRKTISSCPRFYSVGLKVGCSTAVNFKPKSDTELFWFWRL